MVFSQQILWYIVVLGTRVGIVHMIKRIQSESYIDTKISPDLFFTITVPADA